MVSKGCASKHLKIAPRLWLNESKAMLCKECNHEATEESSSP